MENDICAGCLKKYGQTPASRASNGNFCDKCCKEVNLRSEIRQSLMREEGSTLKYGQRTSDYLIKEYEKLGPTVSWETAKNIKINL